MPFKTPPARQVLRDAAWRRSLGKICRVGGYWMVNAAGRFGATRRF
jgi:hypothetical protein